MTNFLCTALLVSLWVHGAHAQITETKLTAGDGVFDDYFGVSVSVSGKHALIGAYGDDDNGFFAGAAYVFQYDGSGWVEQAKLLASDGGSEDWFGGSVSISGDYAIVGSSGDDENGSSSGSAYIFHFDGSNWVEQAKLTAGDGTTNDYFGSSVSISGDNAIVSSLYESNRNGNAAGSAYIFHYNGSTWVQQAKLLASDGEELDNFGRSVAVSGDFAVVGAPYENENSPFAGAAYVFHYNGSTWVEQAKLLASDGFIGEYYGWSVSISGDDVIIGALYDTNGNGAGAGSAYVYHYDGSAWSDEQKLLASDGDVHDWFGNAVSISGDYAIVGSYADDDNGDSGGSAYIFQNDGSDWAELTKVLASDGSAADQFGTSVAISDDHALAGAFWDDENGSSSGSAYAYSGFADSGPGISCDDVRFFSAKCNLNGTVQAIVKMTGEWTGETVTFDLDGDDHVVTVLSNGTNSFAKMQVRGAGVGDHDVTLEDPVGCYSPVHFSCQVDALPDPEWDAVMAEYEAMVDAQTLKALPAETRIIGNHPNPFNPSTTIRYTISIDSPVSVRVYNMLGQEVATLLDEFQKAGEHSVVWDGTNSLGSTVAFRSLHLQTPGWQHCDDSENVVGQVGPR